MWLWLLLLLDALGDWEARQKPEFARMALGRIIGYSHRSAVPGRGVDVYSGEKYFERGNLTMIGDIAFSTGSRAERALTADSS